MAYHETVRDEGLGDVDELPSKADTPGGAEHLKAVGERDKIEPLCNASVDENAQIGRDMLYFGQKRSVSTWPRETHPNGKRKHTSARAEEDDVPSGQGVWPFAGKQHPGPRAVDDDVCAAEEGFEHHPGQGGLDMCPRSRELQ